MKRLALLLALLALVAPARAQSAADFYHEAARLYVGDEREAAEQAAERGLRLAPDDPKLRALLDRIRQDEQQQSGQGGGQNQEPNPNQEGGEQGPQGNEGDPQQEQDREESEGRPEDGDEGAASDRPQQEQPRPEPSEQPQPGREDAPPRPDAPRPGEGEATPEGAAPAVPGQMSRAEAERILNAVGADERLLIRRVQRQPGAGRRVEKDW